MDLKCKKLDCKFNNKYSCMAKDMKVNKSLNCITYAKSDNLDEGQMQDVPKTMFTKIPKYHPYRHIKSLNVHCDANCLFNKSHKCMSNGITVANENKCAKCYTFAKK